MDCKCDKPGWCEAYHMDIIGRLWEICQGKNIDPDKRQKYLGRWGSTAGKNSQTTSLTAQTTSLTPQGSTTVQKAGCGCGQKQRPIGNRNHKIL